MENILPSVLTALTGLLTGSTFMHFHVCLINTTKGEQRRKPFSISVNPAETSQAPFFEFFVVTETQTSFIGQCSSLEVAHYAVSRCRAEQLKSDIKSPCGCIIISDYTWKEFDLGGQRSQNVCTVNKKEHAWAG